MVRVAGVNYLIIRYNYSGSNNFWKVLKLSKSSTTAEEENIEHRIPPRREISNIEIEENVLRHSLFDIRYSIFIFRPTPIPFSDTLHTRF
jgi:hypothetical protein